MIHCNNSRDVNFEKHVHFLSLGISFLNCKINVMNDTHNSSSYIQFIKPKMNIMHTRLNKLMQYLMHIRNIYFKSNTIDCLFDFKCIQIHRLFINHIKATILLWFLIYIVNIL